MSDAWDGLGDPEQPEPLDTDTADLGSAGDDPFAADTSGLGDELYAEPEPREPDLGDLDRADPDDPDGGPQEEAGPADGVAGWGPSDSAAEDGAGGSGADGDPPVGADPDAYGDDPAGVEVFPPALDLADVPEPVDGFPWADPQALDVDADPLPDPAGEFTGGPPVADLYAYTGQDAPAEGGGWAALADSPDPATAALARWWSA